MLLPAAVNPAGRLGFEPLKTSLLRVAAALILSAWLCRRLAHAGQRVDVMRQPVVIAGLGVVLATALSTALSIEPGLSLFGSFDRGMGWLSTAAGGVLLITAADLFADPARRERAISALVVGAILPCAYLLIQRSGLDPVGWTTLGAPGSSLGSPTFLGGYLVLVAPFVVYRVIGAARRPGLAYAAWLALLLVICAVTLLTTIRGPILGLAVGLVVFAAFARGRNRIGRLELAAAGGLLLVAIALAVAATGARGGTAGLQRFLTIAQGNDSSVERLTVWRDAVRIPLVDPLRVAVGYGPETQQATLEQGEATVRLTQNQQWDRAHNLLLDTWLTGGLLGVALLLALIGSGVVGVPRATALGADRLLAAALLAALVGHLVEVSFAFHTVVTGALFWFVLGLVASLRPRHATGQARPRAALGLAAAVVGVALAPLLATPAIADALYGAARRAPYDVGAAQEEVAAGLVPWVEELPRAAGLDWQQVANRRPDDAVRARVEQDLGEAARRAPMEPLPQQRLLRLYLNGGNPGAAENACQRALANGPYRASVWDACADVAAARGDPVAPVRRARGEELRHPL